MCNICIVFPNIVSLAAEVSKICTSSTQIGEGQPDDVRRTQQGVRRATQFYFTYMLQLNLWVISAGFGSADVRLVCR
jgi:hypothetical protein